MRFVLKREAGTIGLPALLMTVLIAAAAICGASWSRRRSWGAFAPARHRGVRPGASSVYGGRWTNENHPARRSCKITGRAGTIEKRVYSLLLFIIFPIHHILADIE